MSKQLFESSWKEDFVFYERVYDTEQKKSIKREVENIYEWYEPSSSGLYRYILDDKVKLDKKIGSSGKYGRNKYGFLDPMFKNIRDNYWNKDLYNLSARTWFIDIETRVGVSYKNTNIDDNKIIKIRIKQ